MLTVSPNLYPATFAKSLDIRVSPLLCLAPHVKTLVELTMSDVTLMMHQELVANVLATISRSSSSEPEMNESVDTNEIPAEIETQPTKKRRRYVTRKRMQVARPLLATTIQVIDKPRHYVNHSYNDFSSVLPEPDDAFPTKIEDMTFAHKLHHMLAQPRRFGKLIHWLPHGRAFKIILPTTFEREVLPIYFGHKRYSTFLRHLDNHGFKLLSSGSNRGSYYHEVRLSEPGDASAKDQLEQ